MDFENGELDNDSTIILIDDDGQEHKFNLINVLTVAEEEYAVLQPEDEDEAIILKFGTDENGDELLFDIESDEEWERVADAWADMQETEE